MKAKNYKMEEVTHDLNLGSTNVSNTNVEMKQKLSELECPFNWNTREILTKLLDNQTFILTLEDKLKEFKNEPVEEVDDNTGELWYKLSLLLILANIYKNEGRTDLAIQKIQECEAIPNILADENRQTKSFLDEIVPAISHMILATKAHLVNDPEDIRLLLQEIVPVDKMTDTVKAGIHGVKSEVFLLLGHSGLILAIDYAEKAIVLNEEESQWWFLAGKAMGRIRRLKAKWRRDLTEKKELEYLEKAVHLKRCPTYMVILAQAYRECARNAFHELQNKTFSDKKQIDEMNKKSLELYKSVIEARSNSPRSLIRCAQGLLNFPKPLKDLAVAKRLIDKCLTMLPNNAYVHHVASMFYQYHELNDGKALEHLEIASKLGNFQATMQQIFLKEKMDPKYDRYEDLQLANLRYTEDDLQSIVEKEFAVYYLFKKRDIIPSLKHLSVLIQKNLGESLKNMLISLFPVYERFNVLQIAVDEARLLRKSSDLTSEDEEVIKTFLENVDLRFPELLQKPLIPNRIEGVIEDVRKIMNTITIKKK